MTKTKILKRAMLMSLFALIICVSMFVGSTFAWFTDSVTSVGNIIKSGKLDVTMEWADGKTDPTNTTWKDASKGAIFNSELWEPGYVEVRHIKIANAGTLALKYQLNILANGAVSELADVIDVYYVDPAQAVENRDALANVEKIGTLSEVLAKVSTTAAGELKAGENHTITLALKMQETAGNEYQDKSIGSDFSVQLLATQLTYEDDSFDNQYDANATLGTYIELNENGDLLAAMASAQADMPLTIKLNGNVEWPTEGHHGENDITPASSILIDGNGYTITATGSGVTPLGDTEAPMTLKNVKIVDNSVSYNEGAWELSYLEMGSKVLNCVNVDFADPISIESDVATFTGCSFVGHYDKNSTSTTQYGVWVANGDSTYTNCIFTGTRGMKICDQYAAEVGTVVIDGCTFNGISEKPGVAIDDEDTQDMNITIKNSTFINCKPGDQNLYVYETDNTVPTVENNTVLNNISEIVEIATKADLFAFAQRINGGDSMSKKLVVLTADIDLENELWTPVGQTGATEFKGIFDGQGHTIKNLNIDSSAQTGEHYSSGLFGWVEGKVTIKNVNIDGATVMGNHNVAALLGYTYSAQISNCHVSNATIVCNHANDDACGDKCGTIVGYAGNESRFTNCSASNSTVTAGRDAGQLIGCGYNVSVSDCAATNVTVSDNTQCTGANINNAIIGRVMG